MARRSPRPDDRGGTGRRPDPTLEDRAVYIISVAAELAGVHPQTLRIYERKGLLSPARTPGNTRRYSDRDIQRLRMIQRLTQDEGLNLAGVKMIAEMEDELDRMRRRLERLDRELRRAERRMTEEVERVRRERASGQIVPMRAVRAFLRDLPGAGRGGGSTRRATGPIAVGPGSTPPEEAR